MAGVAKGVDLRKQGSGNLGATNVFRVLGWKIGLAVFRRHGEGRAARAAASRAACASKCRWRSDGRGPSLCGVAAIVGHVRPIFLKFGKGGKGVATAAGVFFALAPIPMLVTLRRVRRRRARRAATSRSAASSRPSAALLLARHASASARRCFSSASSSRRSSSGLIARTSAGSAAARSIGSASAAAAAARVVIALVIVRRRHEVR